MAVLTNSRCRLRCAGCGWAVPCCAVIFCAVAVQQYHRVAMSLYRSHYHSGCVAGCAYQLKAAGCGLCCAGAVAASLCCVFIVGTVDCGLCCACCCHCTAVILLLAASALFTLSLCDPNCRVLQLIQPASSSMLKSALQLLVSRHPALRTRFEMGGSRPYPVEQPAANCAVPWIEHAAGARMLPLSLLFFSVLSSLCFHPHCALILTALTLTVLSLLALGVSHWQFHFTHFLTHFLSYCAFTLTVLSSALPLILSLFCSCSASLSACLTECISLYFSHCSLALGVSHWLFPFRHLHRRDNRVRNEEAFRCDHWHRRSDWRR